MDASHAPSETAPQRIVELEVDGERTSREAEAHDPNAVRESPASPSRRQRTTEPAAPQPDFEPCAEIALELRVEALLMTTDRPITEARLGEILGLSGKGMNKRVVTAIETLNQQYEQSSRSFRAQRLAGGWQLLTLPMYGPLLHRLHEQRQLTRLSQPALETLAIIAYRQPIMRAEIEAIRGVASGEVLRSLMERRLIKITGRAEELGRPMLYGTTGEFLKVFGLASMDDLPQIKGLNMPSMRRATPVGDADATPRSDAAASKQDDAEVSAGTAPSSDVGAATTEEDSNP
jgi:segregation and condensation protein B